MDGTHKNGERFGLRRDFKRDCATKQFKLASEEEEKEKAKLHVCRWGTTNNSMAIVDAKEKKDA